ncbi:carbohydrate porin [Pseudoalteromonas viridis]|uniref:Carbohydrate porin n=1 Tax=Pseudoalteromonas viridis TaxID=339617 RepID=A0ABX7V0T3_9GAMM|nr:carbohydrate porin [Pseudoalteromonas viridis]QTL34483.1 carbohydrate porin [Pseudoalteromonas viridis]
MSFSARHTVLLSSALLIGSSHVYANTTELDTLKRELASLEDKVAQLESATKNADTSTETPEKGVQVGGAVRFNYGMNSYDQDSERRGGDIDFDLVRINLSGEVADIGINAEVRFHDYMRVVKFAYLDYDITPQWQAQLGLAPVPFGNTPVASHSYFMTPNYFVGLEEDYDLGLVFKRAMKDNWQLDLAFFKNDDHGGIDGSAEDRKDRYSVDIVGLRSAGEGFYDAPGQKLAEYNTLVGRFAYQIEHALGETQFGLSALHGGLDNGINRAGDYQAWAVHASNRYEQWYFHLQHTEYDYQVDESTQLVVAANAMYDTIATKAASTTLGISYDMKVTLGPVSQLTLYNDFGVMHDKSDDSANTWMNITGMSVAAGPVFAYIDLVHAKNQPFVGGTLVGDSDDFERRFNVNIGYYF